MKIRQRGNSWQLDFSVDGKRKQLSFPTKEEAEAEARRLKIGGTSVALTVQERQAFSLARDRLAEVGATIDDAVNFYLEHGAAIREPMILGDMVEACLEAKWEEGKRDRYLAQLKCSGGSFVRWGEPEQLAHEVNAKMVKDWLSSQGWAPKTRNVYLGDLRTIFEWGRENGAVGVNPCKEVKRATIEDAEIEALSVAECARLLVRVMRPAKRGYFAGEDFSPLLPYVVIGLFCGARPEELQRMNWQEVSLEEQTVIVMGRAAKTRQRRVLDLSDNAVRWLELVPEDKRIGSIAPPNFQRRWIRLRRSAGFLARLKEEKEAPDHLRPWPHDAMRHTYATMHYALHRNEMLLQTQMGHSSGAMLFQHYRALASKAVATAFWNLTPPS
jgi:integrase